MADLQTARKDALARSLEVKKIVFIDVDSVTAECDIKDKQSKQSLYAFQSGAEIPVPPLMEVTKKEKAKVKDTKAPSKSKTKSKKVMATAPKKAAKKAAPVKKEKVSGLISKATTLSLSKADWAKLEKAVEAGKGSIRELASKGVMKVI